MTHTEADRIDLEAMLRSFYRAAMNDPVIGFYFAADTGFDLERHLPVIIRFWEQQLYGGPPTNSRTFEVHLALHRRQQLTEHHFRRWLHLFAMAVHSHCDESQAAMVLHKATAIARSMQQGLERFATPSLSLSGVQLFDPQKD